MNPKLQQALDNVQITYKELIDIANDILVEYTKPVDDLIKSTTESIEVLSNDVLGLTIARISLASYSLSEVKEKSALKAECAKALRKEAYSVQFNGTDGSIAAKENKANVEISQEVLAEVLYNYIADMLNIKLDSAHRVVDSLKSVLMGRLSEAKLNKSTTDVMVGE